MQVTDSPLSVTLSPRPVLTQIASTIVVRDDLLPGGTKQRASAPFIQEMIDQGFRHFLYASPFSGFAQVALAYVCQMLEVPCTIVCERDQRFMHDQFHPFSLIAQSYGAKLIMAPDLNQAEDLANQLLLQQNSSMKIPLGFDCASFRHHLKYAVMDAIETIEEQVGPVKNLWLPIGSGTLARTFLTALPERIQIKCVNVKVLSIDDPRIQQLKQHPRIDFFEAPMTFHTAAKHLPPIPSNHFYDAKLWDFINEHGTAGDLWWNVAS